MAHAASGRRDCGQRLGHARTRAGIAGAASGADAGLALDIARHLFATFSILQMGTVIVRRRQLFIPGDVASAEVELTVDREDLEGI